MLTSLFDLPSTWFWKGNRFLSSPEINQQSVYGMQLFVDSCPDKIQFIWVSLREMENISRGPTSGDFVTILTEGSMQDNTVARVQEYRLPFPLSIKCNVLRVGFSKESQNIPCATLKL
jgi:hypothetical protein